MQDVAGALTARGRADYRDIFSGIRVDEASGEVVVHVTEPEQAAAMVTDGLADVPAAQRSETTVGIVDSRYSRLELEQAATGIEVYSVVLPSDGSGLEVRTNPPRRAAALSSAVAGGSALAAEDVDVVPGNEVRPVTRENPAPPWPVASRPGGTGTCRVGTARPRSASATRPGRST